MFSEPRCGTILALWLMFVLAALPAGAFALITGGEGNDPLRDPGWPEGGAKIFNDPARVAWWEGPPLGGGQWHAEYRGSAAELNAVLADFAKLDVKNKRIVVHDGIGRSFWLNPNRTPEKKEEAKIDWTFMVWVPASWKELRRLPTDLNPTKADEQDKGPPSELAIYTGGNIRWADVKLPKGIEVDDRRLEAHGFTPADGVVVEGRVTDLETGKPIAATMRLVRITPKDKGGYDYTPAAEVKADAEGRWVLKNAPAGWHSIEIMAEGYVTRIIGHLQHDEQPSWHSYDGGLARPAVVTGRVLDAEGAPLEDVQVRLGDVTSGKVGYGSTAGYETKTDADGRFRFDQVPVGSASVWIHKPGYVRPGLGEKITMPSDKTELKMIKAAKVRVTVDFTGVDRPEQYIVNIEPLGGSKVGSWGGGGHINADNQMVFENVPPGKYVVQGHPNPTSENQKTKPVTIELKGGETTEITIGYRAGT